MTDKTDPSSQEWQSRALAAESRLSEIYSNPIWKLTKPFRKIFRKKLLLNSYRVPKGNTNPQRVNKEALKNQIRIFNEDKTEYSSIAIIAHWLPNDAHLDFPDSLVDELLEEFERVILVIAIDDLSRKDFYGLLKPRLTVVTKPNLGYDFGSWAIGLEEIVNISNLNELLLVNTSMYGPLDKLTKIIQSLRESKFDVTSITDSVRNSYHLQSFFVHFKNRPIFGENLKKFWKNIEHYEFKSQVILMNEMAMTRNVFLDQKLAGALFPWNSIGSPWINSSLDAWQKLYSLGFPFIKKEALRHASQSEKNKIREILKVKGIES